MTLVGIDDTDSRERGMCTTYVATRLAEAIAEAGGRIVERRLIRLNPAVEWKTRGNAALCVETDLDPGRAGRLAERLVDRFAAVDDPRTSPGVVVAAGEGVPDPVAAFARRAVRERIDLADALALIEDADYRHRGWGDGRGRIGALAAVGAARAFDDWTHEHIAYRALDRCGTPRTVDRDSAFAAAQAAYPDAWDTVDRVEDELVCVPAAPGPILYGIRGDDPEAVRRVAAAIESEPVDRETTFVTNQGTDAHLRPGRVGTVQDGRAYRVDGVVDEAPETRAGGHVHLTLRDGDDRLPCVAFEPTKRFRDRVRGLRPGDRVTVCGEVGEGTLKLEKFALREAVTTERVVPACPDCERSMESAGREQGYRCRDCGTTAPGRVGRDVDRRLDPGWYEVPPCARRHVAKPLVRGGFDAPTHPER
ncbi:tRNA(Ile)(2)-agmatinylcytidine synthase [Haloplanus salinarum]|uniref:tRNA(Ile)(2)-agmatinylcytidine synthase n=1 Tax=Haloplanus salinarum TaxID=1912324 RepID=UPI00214C0C99|nr:tRNA(Ile)(2)-agmatinylcytidine synthase [Haloplanus salinarum]